MTSEDKKRFESQWPAVAARLDRMLARRGVRPERREDIVQETGLRLLGSWERVDASRPLWPFTVTIALNLLRDEARKGVNSEVPCEVPDRSDGSDVESLGLARLEIRRAGLALSQMDPGQRDVLLEELKPSGLPAARSAAATKMLRMRARRKLSLLMQQVSALGVTSFAAIKRAARLGHLYPFSRASEGAVTSALCGVLCVVALSSAVSLAPFSALPDQVDDMIRGGAGLDPSATSDRTAEPGVSSVVTEAGLPTADLWARSNSEPPTERARSGARKPEEAKGAIEAKSSYEIPLGGKPLAEGDVFVEVFDGGHGGSLPTSVDCSERMISPDEIDATCWDQGNPDKRYGVRVRHEGKTTIGELDPSA